MLYIFDLDSTLVTLYGTEPLTGVPACLERLSQEGHDLAVATNQAGPAWRVETRNDKFPRPASLGHRFQEVAEIIPALKSVPWFVAVYDGRLSLDETDYERLIGDFESANGELELHVSSDPTWRKPKPGMLLAACERYGIMPSEAVYVGDAETDAEAAQAAGMSFMTEEAFFRGCGDTAASDAEGR